MIKKRDESLLGMKEIKIKVNILVHYKENEEIKSINVEIPGFYKISDLIRQSVDLFNNLFVEEKSVFRLSQQYSHFSLKPSKRTGKPNLDMPSKKINFNRYNI